MTTKYDWDKAPLWAKFATTTIGGVKHWLPSDSQMQNPNYKLDEWEKRPVEKNHPLQAVFDAAIEQATKGKGERHGGDSVPFYDQQWMRNAKTYGIRGLLFQSSKKLGESVTKTTREDFERELLGAINYAAMAYLFVQEHGYENGS